MKITSEEQINPHYRQAIKRIRATNSISELWQAGWEFEKLHIAGDLTSAEFSDLTGKVLRKVREIEEVL